MKFYGKAEEIAVELIKLFRENKVPQALANVFIKRGNGQHCDSWSWSNQMLVYLHGYNDARGFKDWLSVGRTVKKGEKAFYILAPMKRTSEKDVNGVKEKFSYVYGFRCVPVFGDTQTEGEPLNPEADKFIEGLPLIELAKHWGMKVSTYRGSEGKAYGCFQPQANSIRLGVENPATWAHELIHKSEWMLDQCNSKEYAENREHAEIVAELGGCVLLKSLGLEVESDAGGCYEYIKNWATRTGTDAADLCYKLINRVCKAVDNILTEAEKLHTGELQCELAAV